MKFLVLYRAVSDDEVTVGTPPVSRHRVSTQCVLAEAKGSKAQRPSKHRRAGSLLKKASLCFSLFPTTVSLQGPFPAFGRTSRGPLVWVDLENWKNVEREKAYELEW